MKRIIFGFMASLMALGPLASVSHAAEEPDTTGTVVIRQAYFGSPTNASDEFITLSNTGTESMNLGGFAVEYKAATGKSWYEKARVADGVVLPGGSDYMFATQRDRDAELGSGFAQSIGNVRVVSAQGEVIDALAWGTGDSAEGTAAQAPRPGEELSRKLDAAGVLIDTGNNAADFEVVNVDNVVEEPQIDSPDTSIPATQPFADASIEITELFPDPASPATDSADEFIELYNAGSDAVDLSGWKLQDAAGHSTPLDGVVIGAGQYIALMALQTKLSLNNSGDTISLINPAGEAVMVTPNYEAAREGLTYGTSSDGWGWLASPTPNAANSGLANEDVVAAAATKAKSKKATAKNTKKKAKSAKAKTPKLAKTASASAANNQADLVDAQTESVPWQWLVAGLGVLAVGYGVYEYRPEITSFVTKLRAKFSARS